MTKTELTIVIPTYEPHFKAAERLISSMACHMGDADMVEICIVVEEKNVPFVDILASRYPSLSIRSVSSENALAGMGISGDAEQLLKRVGKYSFQSLKKIGGILQAKSDWVLVLDSESLFLRPFSAIELLSDYRSQRYVFYSRVNYRGETWGNSLSDIITRNASMLLGGKPDRWFLEYYHWFYEVRVWRDLIDQIRQSGCLQTIIRGDLEKGVFENVLYYQYVSNNARYGYRLIDVQQIALEELPSYLLERIDSALKGRLAIMGILEHITSLVSRNELKDLSPLFSRFRLPFVRLEPMSLDPEFLIELQQIPTVCAITSSHHLNVMEKRVALCVSGEFRSVFNNIRSIRSFVTGVACDIYVYGTENENLPAIKDSLSPYQIKAEGAPDFSDILTRVNDHEPGIKPGRDEGTLRMLFGIQQCMEMVEQNIDCYAYVVRTRPDIFFEQSLRDILLDIANFEDDRDNLIYVPNSFHSQGLNDQFAIGTPQAMRLFSRAFDYAKTYAATEYFNPEHIVNCNALEAGLTIKTLPMNYVLLRSEPANLDWVGRLHQNQKETWWSSFLPLSWEPHEATSYFEAKRGAMRLMAEGGYFEDWDLTIDSANLTPEAKLFWRAPLIQIRVQHDYKNPEVMLTVPVCVRGNWERYFIEVTDGGLRIVYGKPDGVLLAGSGDDPSRITLTRFVKQLDKPFATMTVQGLYPVGLPRSAFSHEQNDALMDATRSAALIAPEPRVHTAKARVDSIAPGTDLLEHMVLAETSRRSAFSSRLAAYFIHRGRRMRRKGDLKKADVFYARALQTDPFQPREWIQYGHVLRDQGDQVSAEAAYRTALLLSPGNSDAEFWRQTTVDG